MTFGFTSKAPLMLNRNKKSEVLAIEPSSKKLTELEALKLEQSALVAEFRLKEKENLDLQDKIIFLKKENLSLRIQSLDSSKVQSNENRKALEEQTKLDLAKTKELHSDIKKRLDIEADRFGYNPDTLEIVLDH